MAGLTGDVSKLKAFSAGLIRASSRVVAQRIAARGADKITARAQATFNAGENAYGDSWAPGHDGERVKLTKSGALGRFVRYVAIGTVLRCVLGVPWAKYQIGKRPIFPRAGAKLPAEYAQDLTAIAKDEIRAELEGGSP